MPPKSSSKPAIGASLRKTFSLCICDHYLLRHVGDIVAIGLLAHERQTINVRFRAIALPANHSRCRIHVALVNASSWRQSANASFHSARVIPKRPRNRSPAKREFFGLTAGCGNSELAIGVTLGFFQLTSGLPVTSSKMVSAKPHQLVEPPAVRLRIPDAKSAWPRCEQARSMMSAVALAIWRAQVGAPNWSATIDSSSRCCANRSIVRKKLWPRAAYTQLVRRIR